MKERIRYSAFLTDKDKALFEQQFSVYERERRVDLRSNRVSASADNLDSDYPTHG